jgi:hypothetical protein
LPVGLRTESVSEERAASSEQQAASNEHALTASHCFSLLHPASLLSPCSHPIFTLPSPCLLSHPACSHPACSSPHPLQAAAFSSRLRARLPLRIPTTINRDCASKMTAPEPHRAASTITVSLTLTLTRTRTLNSTRLLESYT